MPSTKRPWRKGASCTSATGGQADSGGTREYLSEAATTVATATVLPLSPFQPDLHERAWASIPHPTVPLLATTHAKGVTVFSLATLFPHSSLTGGHTRSVRTAAWEPGLSSDKLCLVTGSFDSTAGFWRWDENAAIDNVETNRVERTLESEATTSWGDTIGTDGDRDWEFSVVLEGHESEIKSCAFSPSAAFLATCSRDKTIWIWENVGGPSGSEDEWETVAILNEHEGDVKAVRWCPDVPGRNSRRSYGPEVLASASYDNTVRMWREDADADWVCVAVLDGHDGTVWGIEWESCPARKDRFPRLLTCSADATVRVWTLKEDEADRDGNDSPALRSTGRGALGGVPNTMRASLRDEWTCTAVLPKAHERDIYAVTWSSQSGLVASAGSDGTIALYVEAETSRARSCGATGADPVCDIAHFAATGPSSPTASWGLLATVPNAHGPYEINHITWCNRYDAASACRGEEEMLVSTGDDGLVRPWKVRLEPSACPDGQEPTGCANAP
ncbi:hypothetical protein CDD83_2523 [Cordyceps sp. RAO-2017]|nr:hypothetical protein CDD83_2523 [Cordyceps sp. RAO-2017]